MSIITPTPDFDEVFYNELTTINATDPLIYTPTTKNMSIKECSTTNKGILNLTNQSIAGIKNFTSCPQSSIAPLTSYDMTNKQYVDQLISAGLTWKQACISFIDMSTVVNPSAGDRYVSTTTDVNFTVNWIYEYNGTAWIEITVSEGDCFYVSSDTSVQFANQCVYFNGTTYINFSGSLTHQGLVGSGTLTHATIDSYMNQALKTTSSPSFSKITISGTDVSTSSTTGALIVNGGVGINNLSYGTITSNKTAGVYMEGDYGNIQFKSTATGSSFWTIKGGDNATLLSVNNSGHAYIGTSSCSTVNSTSTNTGSLVVYGGIGAVKDCVIGGKVKILDTTATISSSTGSLIVGGGIACGNRILFPSDSEKKKIVLYDGFNDYQFNGFGMQSSELRYQISGTTLHHSFYAGNGTTSDQELMRIEGSLSAPQGVKIYHSTQSTSSSTGSLNVLGGVGIVKDVYIGGVCNVVNTTESTSISTGSMIINGGVGIMKKVFIGGDTEINSAGTNGCLSITRLGGYPQVRINNGSANLFMYTLGSVETSTSCGGKIYVTGGASSVSSSITIGDTTQSTSTNSGALLTLGGVGIAKDVYIGGALTTLDRITSSHSASTAGDYVLTVQNTYPTSTTAINDPKPILYMTRLGTDTVTYPASALFNIDRYENVASHSRTRLTIGLAHAGGVSVNHSQLYSDGRIALLGTLESTSSSTGTLIVNGGVGIAKDVYIGGTLYGNISTTSLTLSSTNDATSNTTGSLNVAGGIGITKNVYMKATTATNSITFDTTYNSLNSVSIISNSPTNGIKIESGAGIEMGSQTKFLATTQSSSSTTGSLIVNGGVGIQKSLNVGGECVIINSTDSTSSSTGALRIIGGLGIEKALHLGTNLYVGGTIYPSEYVINSAWDNICDINPTQRLTITTNGTTITITANLSSTQTVNSEATSPYVTALPSIYRPASTIIIPMFYHENSSVIPGLISIDPNGILSFSNTSFGTPVTIGMSFYMYPWSATYYKE